MQLIQGIISSTHIGKLRQLTFSDEERYIVDRIASSTQQLKLYATINFILNTLYTTVFYLLIIFIKDILDFPKMYVFAIFFILVLFSSLFLYANVFKYCLALNTYKRLVGSLLDNLLNLLIDRYRISLARLITSYPSPKDIAKTLEECALSLGMLLNGIASLLGLFIGVVIVTAVAIFTSNFILLWSVALTLLVVIVFLMFLQVGAKFSPKEKAFFAADDKFDIEFNETQGLFFRTGLNLYPKEFDKLLNEVVNITTIVNFISTFAKQFLPLLFLFLPFFFGNSGLSVLFLIQGLYVMSLVFGHVPMISQTHKIKMAQVRLSQLDELLEKIIEEGAELTPALYEDYKKEYVKKRGGVSLIDTLEPGSLIVKKLSYISGRDENKIKIYVDDLNLDSGKVHFLIGDSGLGKSLFGRTCTLRYADFEAEFLGLNYRDLRTFTSLDEGLKNLHFSGLRPIKTSYRFALGVYLNPDVGENLFVKRLSLFKPELSKLRKHFELNTAYYNGILPSIYKALDAYAKNPSSFDLNIQHLSKGERHQVREIFRNKLIASDKNVSDKVYLIALLTEYIGFAHLKLYIPEATLYFMDAILSEPPISQGQRRRILFALDILVRGRVFVVDEPFANLDIQTSKNILLTLINYASHNKAVVLILDQKLHSELINLAKEEEKGKVLMFANLDNKIQIVEMA